MGRLEVFCRTVFCGRLRSARRFYARLNQCVSGFAKKSRLHNEVERFVLFFNLCFTSTDESAHRLKKSIITKSFDKKLPGDRPGDRGPGTFVSNDLLFFFSIFVSMQRRKESYIYRNMRLNFKSSFSEVPSPSEIWKYSA